LQTVSNDEVTSERVSYFGGFYSGKVRKGQLKLKKG